MSIETESLSSPEIWKNKTILIVDDDEGARALGQAIFRRKSPSVKVLTAEDGQEAMEIIQQKMAAGEKIDLVVTDYHMPNINGPQLIERIRSWENLPQPLIVLVSGERFTGLSQSQLEEAARKYQANFVMEKPYSPLQITTMVVKAWQSQNSPV